MEGTNTPGMHSSTAVKPPVAPTKLSHLVKRPDFEGYGFNLHSEKSKPGQFIGKVDAGSPAEAAGLKKGDRIIEVNGVAIGIETHKQVVQRIKAIENEVRLLLIDVDGLKTYENQEQLKERQEPNLKTNDNKSDANSETETSISIHYKNNSNNPTNSNIQIEKQSTALPVVANTTSTVQPQQLTNYNGDTLLLPLTVAEMRAKLMSKKKYDPKSETVDIKKKFQIIQTL